MLWLHCDRIDLLPTRGRLIIRFGGGGGGGGGGLIYNQRKMAFSVMSTFHK